jgi:hypothetical protein
MSLILGYAAPDICFLVADTQLSFRNDLYIPRRGTVERFHVLKIQILSPTVAVAFAGDAETSLHVIRRLHQELAHERTPNVAQRLLELYGELACEKRGEFQDCEFLILLLIPGHNKLLRVANDQIYEVRRAYIGDPDEYRNYTRLLKPYCGPDSRSFQDAQGAFHIMPVTEGEQEFDRVSTAMEKLTHQTSSTTVGAICGCIIRVVDGRMSRMLEYMQSGEVGISPWEGCTGFSLLASNSDPRGVGIYYHGWGNGLIFIVADYVTCRKEAATTIRQFIELAKVKYGLNLEGPTW